MSLLSGISVLTQSLRNFNVAEQTINHNIANVGTAGFSRQVVSYSTNTPLNNSGFFVGQGSQLSSINRVRDNFLDIQIRTQTSELEYYNTLNNTLGQLAAIFPDILTSGATTGIAGKTDAFYTSWSDLAASIDAGDPPSTIQGFKQAVISQAVDLAQELKTTAVNLGDLRSSINIEVANKINEANSLLQQIGALNDQIMKIPASFGSPNDLLDARDLALEKLSAIIDIRTVSTQKGSIDVLFESGPLVSGKKVFDLFVINRVPDPALNKVGYRGDISNATDVTKNFTRGELGALLEMRDTIIEDAIFNIQAFGTGLIENTNFVYEAGQDLGGNHGKFFTGNNAQSINVVPTLANSLTGAELLVSYQDMVSAPAFVLDPTGLDPAGLARDMANLKNMFSANFIQSSQPIRGVVPGSVTFDASRPLGEGDGILNPFPNPWVWNPTSLTVPTAASGVFGELKIDISPSSSATVLYNENTTMLEVVEQINEQLSGSAMAAYDEISGKFTIISSQPVSVYDNNLNGNLAAALNLTMQVTSATNVNSTVLPQVLPVSQFDNLNSNAALLNYFKEFSIGGGSFTLDNNLINWVDTDPLFFINLLTIPPAATANFDAVTQRLNISRTIGPPTPGNPLTFWEGADVSGNFLSNFSIGASSSPAGRYQAFQTDVSVRQAVTDANRLGAQATLDALTGQRDSKSAVNLMEETAKMIAFQRSFEASIRVMGVLDQMLNVLINGTASQSAPLSTSRLS